MFDDNYARMCPDDLRAYLACHRHLPHMPSSAQIERDGLDLGASQLSLLQTTEELTLDMLDQHADVKSLRRASAQKDAQIAALTARLARLEAAVSKLAEHKPARD